jgi:signal transduction histidine kinase
MFRTIFHKMILIFIVALFLCFNLTAILFNASLNRYVINQRSEVLNIYGERICSALGILVDNRMDAASSIIFQNMLEVVANNTSSLIWIVDDMGNILAYSRIPAQFTKKLQINHGIYQLTNPKQYAMSGLDGSINETGNFYGLFEETGMQWLTVKIPFSFPNVIINERTFQGNVMLHTPIPEIKKTGSAIINLFLPSITISLVVSLFFLYFLSKRITSPLKQMTEAARKISSGDWQNRLTYKGNDEVAILAESFNHMIETLENLEKMRRDFVANISHELRTPMTSINGFIEGILDGTIPEDRQKEYLAIVKDEVKRLQRLVSDMLDIARMEAGETKLNITVFDICEIVRISVIQLQQYLEEKDINFRANFEQEVMIVKADRDAIQRVLINLLHNAVKFTPRGGQISVSITGSRGKAEITVSDTGVGIPAEDLPFIFDRFHKGDKSRGRDKTSVGLGLYIVKNIIKAHNEEINVNSEINKGTSFIFSLPLNDL